MCTIWVIYNCKLTLSLHLILSESDQIMITFLLMLVLLWVFFSLCWRVEATRTRPNNCLEMLLFHLTKPRHFFNDRWESAENLDLLSFCMRVDVDRETLRGPLQSSIWLCVDFAVAGGVLYTTLSHKTVLVFRSPSLSLSLYADNNLLYFI